MDGSLKKQSIDTNVRAPGGRLIQKDHHHIAFSIKAPPMTSAKMRPIAKQLLHMPRSSCFRFFGRNSENNNNPPLATPDSPMCYCTIHNEGAAIWSKATYEAADQKYGKEYYVPSAAW